LGLLLLRATVGIAAAVQGGIYLTESGDQTLRTWAFGLPTVVSGASLLIGFLTPVAAVLAGLGSVGIAFWWFPAPTPNFLDARLATFFVTITAVAIVFLGPGAFSLDCYLFGRRETIIPPTSRSPKSSGETSKVCSSDIKRRTFSRRVVYGSCGLNRMPAVTEVPVPRPHRW